jgi:hypothetical protein
METHDDWVMSGYEIWDFRSVNRLYVDNLGPPDIGETIEISVDYYMRIVYI